jgi:hypothetical protein
MEQNNSGDVVFSSIQQITQAINNMAKTMSNGASSFVSLPKLPSYTVAGVPSASQFAQGMIYVSNESGGAVVAFSDGTNWRRVKDRAIIS